MDSRELARWINAHCKANQKAFSELIGVNRSTVNNWLKRGKVPLWVPKMLELIEYREAIEGKQ